MEGKMQLFVTTVVVVVALGFLGNARADVFYGLDSVLAQSHSDPLALNDSFSSLPGSLKRALAQSSGHPDIAGKMRALQSLQTAVPVTIKLAGFSRDERALVESEIGAYVETLSRDHHFMVVGGDLHDLMLGVKVIIGVASVPNELSERISSAIDSHLPKTAPPPFSHSLLHAVDFSVVDDIVREDLGEALTGYTIYLLNPKTAPSQPYAYKYSRADPSPAYTRCLGTLWAGKERYMWIDLAAGPVEYGPALSGEGLLPRGESHPLTALRSSHPGQGAFTADLASLVWSAARMLFAPALRVPAQFATDMEVNIIHIQSPGVESDPKSIDWDAIEKTFSGLPLLPGQHLRFKRYHIKYSSCALCVAAVSRSLRSYTARFLFDNYTMIVNEYIDSKQLHFGLKQARQDLAIKAGIPHSSSGGRAVPVYVFDLDYERQLLLDRYHPAVAFRDMVIAVRTKSVQAVSDYTCNGRHVITQIRDLERPVVASLLQTLWGVAPTHLTWSPQHNGTAVDYMWSVGHTPFGPFSDSLSMSFAQIDATLRNGVLTTLNTSISSAFDVLRSTQLYGSEKKLLGKRHMEFTQRWNVYLFKLEKAVSALSHLDFNMALYFVKSADHDLFSLHGIVFAAASDLQPSMVCFKDPPFPWRYILVFTVPIVVVAYVWGKKEVLFSNKKKRF